MELKDLLVDHDYYCSESNYYSNEAFLKYEVFSDFYEDFKGADVDMNLIFRWDLKEREESGRCYLKLFMMQQRKGIFMPIYISLFDKKDIPLLQEYLQPHIDKIKSIWKPFKF